MRAHPHGPAVSAALAALLLTVGAPDLHAQEATSEHELRGTVVDASSGEPVARAIVGLKEADRGVFTGSDGTFRIGGVSAGSHVLVAERLGYRTASARVIVGENDATNPVRLALEPDPVLLEGVQVVTSRFQRRRNATASSVHAFQQDDLLSAQHVSVAEFIEARAGVPIVNCPARFTQFNCALVRGRARPVSVYVDEAPVFAGLDQLDAYLPGDLHLLEIYGRGQHIRAYTHSFMERAAETRLWPIPLFF